MQAWITQLRKGMAELCVLNLLQQGSTYGYEIVKQLGKIQPLGLSESTVYPLLTRLRREELVEVRAAASPHGPRRRYFSLTQAGEKRLAQMNRYWSQVVEAVSATTAAQTAKPSRQQGV